MKVFFFVTKVSWDELEVGFGVFGFEEVFEDELIDLGIECFADKECVVFFDECRLVGLDGGSKAIGAGECIEVGSAPEGNHGSIHAFDKFWVRQCAFGGEVDGLDVGAASHESVELCAKVKNGFFCAFPSFASGLGVCYTFDSGHAVTLAIDKPVFEWELFEKVGDGRGFHQAFGFGDKPRACGYWEGVVIVWVVEVELVIFSLEEP